VACLIEVDSTFLPNFSISTCDSSFARCVDSPLTLLLSPLPNSATTFSPTSSFRPTTRPLPPIPSKFTSYRIPLTSRQLLPWHKASLERYNFLLVQPRKTMRNWETKCSTLVFTEIQLLVDKVLLLRPSTWLHSPISMLAELLGSLSSAFLISFSLSTKRSNSSRESENSNQLGYTTPAIQGRTSFYATDLAKSISAPVLHVNGDRIDDVARCLRLALAYQRKFRKDVIVDLVVYRRLGHNELDEPSFTSPIMYRRIKDLPSVASIYEKSLIETGTLDSSDVASFKKEHFAKLDTSLSTHPTLHRSRKNTLRNLTLRSSLLNQRISKYRNWRCREDGTR